MPGPWKASRGLSLCCCRRGNPARIGGGADSLWCHGNGPCARKLGLGSTGRGDRAAGFGQADLIIAVPKIWADVDTLDDLDAVAAAFRADHGFRLRIATKYHRLVREFLRDNGVADYQLVDSQGATEGTVKNLTAEAVADITSTGDTLRANHLKNSCRWAYPAVAGNPVAQPQGSGRRGAKGGAGGADPQT